TSAASSNPMPAVPATSSPPTAWATASPTTMPDAASPAGGPGRRRHQGPPRWWPEGEPWPPTGPPWRHAPVRFRRRLLLFVVLVFALLAGLGMIAGAVFWHGGGHPGPAGPNGSGAGRRGPFPGLAVVVGLAA